MASPTLFGALIPWQQPTYDPFHLLTVSLFKDQSRPGAFTKHLRTSHLRTSTHHFPWPMIAWPMEQALWTPHVA